MSERRMTAEDRKAAIVRAVLPIFARKGFAETTTRQLAEAAGISEALLYKHFPSKESLYTEIQHHGCHGCDPSLEKLVGLPPSTSTLVYVVYYVIRANMVGRSRETIDHDTRLRLLLKSCLEDGVFARSLLKNRLAECLPRIEACMEAAARSGDLVGGPLTHRNRLLFTHHLAVMIGTMHLPHKAVVDYQVAREELLKETVWYALRGLGLRDEAIAKHFDQHALALFFGDEHL
jgi:AcrR family transcriptional regulator